MFQKWILKSADKRNAGNTAFQKKKDTEALNLYSEAVFAADVVTDEGKKDCALALANRYWWAKDLEIESKKLNRGLLL